MRIHFKKRTLKPSGGQSRRTAFTEGKVMLVLLGSAENIYIVMKMEMLFIDLTKNIDIIIVGVWEWERWS